LKRKLLSAILTLATLVTSAQHVIKGKVIDDNGRPVISANILLQQKSDKSILQTSITDSDGVFLLIPKKTMHHQLAVTARGFETAFTDLPDSFKQDTTLLIRLTIQGKQLNQVSIYAKAPLIERKTDRILFNVENSLSAIGGDGIDALSKAPGVRVNDNGIKIVGKSSIKVMVNDRLIQLSGTDLISYVKSIPSANIKRIEIITNPSARYEADGNSGLINIVLKRNLAQGFNGTVNTGVILASRYTSGLTAIFNYNADKLHVSSNLTGVYSEIEGTGLSSYSTPSLLWKQQSNTVTKGKGIRGDLKIDYDLTANTVAGLKYMDGRRWYTVNLKEQGLFHTLPSYRIDSSLVNIGRNKQDYDLVNFEFYLDHKIDTAGNKIEFSSNYFRYGTDDDNLFQSVNYSHQNLLLKSYQPIGTAENEHIEIFTNKLDITLPFKLLSLEFGGKISNIKNKNNLNYSAGSNTGMFNNNVFDYTENSQSLYGTADKGFGQWAVRVGLRMELTQTTGNSSVQEPVQKNTYNKLFPTFYLKYNLNKHSVLSFTYGKRINRPNYSLLNPARIYSAVNIYREGNPLLTPSFSNNFEISYNYKDWLNTSVYTNFVSNGFSTLNFIDPANTVQTSLPKNYANSVTSGLSETISVSKISWWESNNQFNVYVEKSESNGAITEGTIRKWSGYISTDNSFTLNSKKTLMANATFWYQFPEVYNRLIYSAYYAADLSFRAIFMDRRLTFAVNVSDAFKTSRSESNGRINGVKQFGTIYNDNRKTRFSIVYRFGNSKGNRTVRTSDDAETNRVKQGT
jgi:hypothetical protein